MQFLLSQMNHIPMVQRSIMNNELNILGDHGLFFCEQLMSLMRFFIRFIDLQIISLCSSLTDNFSLSYPPGYMVGTVAAIVEDNSTNFYVLRIKPAVNFSDLQQVMLVENLEYTDQARLLEETKKRVEEVKKPAQ